MGGWSFSKECPGTFFANGYQEHNGNVVSMLLSFLDSNIFYFGKIMAGWKFFLRISAKIFWQQHVYSFFYIFRFSRIFVNL